MPVQTRRCVASLYCGRLVNRGGGQGQAWQAELQLENGFSGFEVSLLFLVFLNILMHNEGPQ